MKVLVIGRSGQVARALVEAAEGRESLELVAVGRPELDLERSETVAKVVRRVRPEVVINAAAYTAVDQAEVEPRKAHRINAEGAGTIAREARAAGAAFIHLSTDYVFSGEQCEPYRDDSPTGPLGVYGRTKLEGEEHVRAEALDHMIVRTAWVYSPFAPNFVCTMMRLASEHERLAVVDDQRGSPTSAADLADALLRVVDEWRQGKRTGMGATYHVTNSGVATWAEFAGAIFTECRRLGLPAAEVQPIPTGDWPAKASRPMYSVLDCTRFTRDFGYRLPDWRISIAGVVSRIAGVDGGR